MKKLCIAVIVLSFFGFGPLKSLFQGGTGIEGADTSKIPFLEKIKDSEGSSQITTFLIMNKGLEHDSRAVKSAMLLKYHSAENKIEAGSIQPPKITLTGTSKELDKLKKGVEENYQVNIDYSFMINLSGIAGILDLVAPNGIEVNTGSDGHLDRKQNVMDGEDFVLYLEKFQSQPNNEEEMLPILLSVKEEVMKSLNGEKIVNLAPVLFDEALKSIETDMGKGKLMELGLAVMTKSIPSIEQIEYITVTQQEEAEQVNKDLHEDEEIPVLY